MCTYSVSSIIRLCGCCCFFRSCLFSVIVPWSKYMHCLFANATTTITTTTQPQYDIAAMWRCHGQKRDESTSNIDAVGTRFIPLPLWLCSNIFLTCSNFVHRIQTEPFQGRMCARVSKCIEMNEWRRNKNESQIKPTQKSQILTSCFISIFLVANETKGKMGIEIDGHEKEG